MSDVFLGSDSDLTEQQVLNRIALSARGTAGGKTLSNDAAGVVLESDTKCRGVFITCRTGVIAIGFSSAVNAEAANAVGLIITPGSTVVYILCTNLNQVYLAGTGRVGYAYH